jgi:hypothetical protein
MRFVSLRFVVLLVLGTLLSLVPLGASAAPSDASVAAHACENGGYLTLHRADGTGFTNAGECTSYAAHGGQFQTATLSITIGSAQYTTDPDARIGTISGTGLLPGTDVTLDLIYLSFPPYNGIVLGQAQADGTFSIQMFYGCQGFSSFIANGTATNGTPVSSGPVAATC